MQFKVPHRSTKEATITKIRQLIAEKRAELEQHASDIKLEWKDNVLEYAFTAQGSHIEGTLTITDTDFEVYAKLPLMYRMFEGMLERKIEGELAKMKLT